MVCFVSGMCRQGMHSLFSFFLCPSHSFSPNCFTKPYWICLLSHSPGRLLLALLGRGETRGKSRVKCIYFSFCVSPLRALSVWFTIDSCRLSQQSCPLSPLEANSFLPLPPLSNLGRWSLHYAVLRQARYTTQRRDAFHIKICYNMCFLQYFCDL